MVTLVFAWWLGIVAPAPPGWDVSAISKMDDFVLTVETGTREQEVLFLARDGEVVDATVAQVVEPIANGVRLWLRKSPALGKPPRYLRGFLRLSSGRLYLVSARLDVDE